MTNLIHGSIPCFFFDNSFCFNFLRCGCTQISKCTPQGRVPQKSKERKVDDTQQVRLAYSFTLHQMNLPLWLHNNDDIKKKSTCLYGTDDKQNQLQFGIPAAFFATAGKPINIRIKDDNTKLHPTGLLSSGQPGGLPC
jgi:hypothetical protein